MSSANIYQNQDKNIFRTWILMIAFFVLVVAIGWGTSYYFADPSILFIAVAFAVFMNIFSFWFSDKIALSTSGAKKASEEEYKELHRIVENLSITAGLPKPRIYIIPERIPNAFATGRNPENSAVAVTTGLLDILDRSELEGVIAHELSHIGNRDILVMSVAVVLAGFITLLADFFIRGTFWGMGGSRREGGGGVLVIIGLVLAILAPIFASLIRLAISRKREFLADSSGALLTRYPEGLASALQKISNYSGTMKRANHATAHLFISNPFGGKGRKRSWLAGFFATHPPVEDRVRALTGR